MGEFFFYDYRGAMEWGAAYYKSGYNPGHLPKPGGISVQSKQVKHDLRTFLRGVAWAQAKGEKTGDDDERWLDET